MIGQLKERLILQERVSSLDTGGGRQDHWQDLTENAVVWAKLEPKKARDIYAFHQLQQDQTHVIILRYRADVNMHMRLRKGGRIFAILSAYDPHENGQYLYLNCREQPQNQI